jgi:hypothetical protein
MGGTRLKKFMESVEKVSGSIRQAPFGDEAAASDRERAETQSNGEASEAAPAADVAPAQALIVPGADAWSEVLATGAALLQQLSGALRADGQGASALPPGIAESILERDDQTGQTYLKVPMPQPEMLARALGSLRNLLGGL